ncbi:MAG: hypothetical protein EOP06_08135, partial [Proteobacteria bacterium]
MKRGMRSMRRLKFTGVLLLCLTAFCHLSQAQAMGPSNSASGHENYQPSKPEVSLSSEQVAGKAQEASVEAEAEQKKAAALDPAVISCIEKNKNAKLACATLSAVTGLGATEGALLESILMSQLPALITSMSGKSGAEQCRLQSDMNKLVTTISVLKTGACVLMTNSCNSKCGADEKTAEEAYKNQAALANAAKGQPTYEELRAEAVRLEKIRTAIATERRGCGAYKTNIAMMVVQAGLGVRNMLASNQCSDDLSETALMTPPPLSLTASNVDCSNPSFAATNMACICRSTPSDPMCAQFNAGAGNGAGGAGVVGGSVTTPGLSTEEATDGQVVDPAPEFKGTTGSNTAGSGGGGGGLGAGGGGGLLGGGEGEGGGGSGLDKNVITGTSGSGGGGVAGLTAGSGGGGARGGGSGGGSGGGGSFDFKKYLPKSLFKNRGLAGMTVPSTDGVTGPMGPSL